MSCNSAFFSVKPYKKPGYVAWIQTEFIQAFTFLIDNIYVKFGDNIYHQTLGIPMGTDCAPLLADLYLYTYEYDFLDSLTKSKKLHLAKTFNFTFRYIDDLISINYKHFNTHISDIYPPELELKETTESTTTVSYHDLLVDIDSFLTFKLFDKRDYFNFPIVNFPHLDSNIPVKPAYGVYVSQLIRCFRACTYYSDFSIDTNF